MPRALRISLPIRLAVVGVGQISELMLPAYAANEDVDVVALSDLNPERPVRWAEAFRTAVRSTDLEVALAQQPDVVDVLVPTPLHAEVVIDVLDAGEEDAPLMDGITAHQVLRALVAGLESDRVGAPVDVASVTTYTA